MVSDNSPVKPYKANGCSPGPSAYITDHTVKGVMTLAFVEACHQAKIP